MGFKGFREKHRIVDKSPGISIKKMTKQLKSLNCSMISSGMNLITNTSSDSDKDDLILRCLKTIYASYFVLILYLIKSTLPVINSLMVHRKPINGLFLIVY